MVYFLKRFRLNEDGAVTVDWVVLAAATVGLGFSVLSSVASSAVDRGDDAATCMARIAWNVDPNNRVNDSYTERLIRADERCERDNI